MSNKYHNPSGFPENLPQEQIVEEQMKATMRRVCESFGYVPVETSAVEYMDTLASKGDITKEIYTIARAAAEGESTEADRGLRFDLTVPFARYTAQHYGDLVFPFKRYQIQRVWRGERPQKGRFREFYQADIDVIANEKLPLHFDAEVVSVFRQVLVSFGLPKITIHLNNRKFLQGLLEASGITATDTALRVIDKIDKVGIEKTYADLVTETGITTQTAEKLLKTLSTPIALVDIPAFLNTIENSNESLQAGKEELLAVTTLLEDTENSHIVLNPRIARGFDYYTGSVYETTIDGYEKYGAISAGGRYADLAGRFINRKLPGVGISIGLSRLLDIMKHENLVAFEKTTLTKVLIGLLGEEQRIDVQKIATQLRDAGINTEIYYNGETDLGKQIQFKEKKNIPFFLVLNTDGTFRLKKDVETEYTCASIAEVVGKVQ